jgi:hypothetical protein
MGEETNTQIVLVKSQSWRRTVGMATRTWDRRCELRISATTTDRPDWLRGPLILQFNGYQGSFPGTSDIYYSPPPSPEAKKEWNYTSTPPVCLHNVDRETFTFLGEKYLEMGSKILKRTPGKYVSIKVPIHVRV